MLCPPSWSPMLPPSIVYMAGAPHAPSNALPRPADHGAAAVAAADTDRHVHHRRNDDHALGLLEQVRGDVLLGVEDFLHHDAAILEAALLLVLGAEGRHTEDNAEGEDVPGHVVILPEN